MRVIYRIISELFLLISPIIILYRVFIGEEKTQVSNDMLLTQRES